VDNYHSVPIQNIRIKLSGVEPTYPVDIRIYVLDCTLLKNTFTLNISKIVFT